MLSVRKSICLRFQSSVDGVDQSSASWHSSSLHSLTWKCGLETHFAICLKSGSMIFTNCGGSMTSRISSISPKNIASFCEHVFGQYLSKPRTTGSVSEASFSKNWTTQYASWAWYSDKHLTLCNGNRTFTRNCLCSAFNGNAKPLMILRKGMKRKRWES